jgi:hypothetical protein
MRSFDSERARSLSAFSFCFPNPECGCPILAFFARVGSDAVCTIGFMPTGLQRTYGAHHVHFITRSCYRRWVCEFAEEWQMKSRTKISFRALPLNQPVAQALPVPTLRKEREGWGIPRCL